jgi:2-oxoglutarate ferredoxin oxidoreductase subunit gamma
VVNVVGAQVVPDLPGQRVIQVPATSEAERLGCPQAANVMLLGALLAARPLLPQEAIERALRAHLPAHHHDKLEANLRALQRGAALASGTLIAAAT